MKRCSLLLLAVIACFRIQGQAVTEKDTVPGDSAVQLQVLSTRDAWNYLDEAVRDTSLWLRKDDSLRHALQRLLEHSIAPFDSVRALIGTRKLRGIPVQKGGPVLAESIPVRWINDSTFAVDPEGWNADLYLKKEPRLVYPVDFSTLRLSDSILDENGMLNATLFTPDTVMVDVIDTAAIRSLGISIHRLSGGGIQPPLTGPGDPRTARLSGDSTRVLYYVANRSWVTVEASPFQSLKSPNQLDSLQMAIDALLGFTERRDSTLLVINDLYGKKLPMWLTTGSDDPVRFWIKNYNNDSITLWVGNPRSGEISLMLEDDVNFTRLIREDISYLPSFIQEPERTLHTMTLLEPLPIYWDYEFSSLFSLSQTYLANWTKGGESSLSGLMDLMGRATYNNKEANTQWINIFRLKFGAIMTQDEVRKNQDEFEIDSRYNRNAWRKIGFSASLYMKHQLAKGYNYSEEPPEVVSKFISPGTMTVGLGIEYKPMEKTTVNVAPLSYKTTFVLDTVLIDQSAHGVPEGQRAKREMGLQIAANNTLNPMKDMEITNRIRLFSNYLKNPQNVDVDWEFILEKQISWFFTVRLNLHLIYDDDVHFKVLDANDDPVLNPDGSEKKVARTQFKEYVGLALSFKF
jgi:hypothetical protein